MPSFTTYISFPSQHKALAHSKKKNQTKKSNKWMICDDIMPQYVGACKQILPRESLKNSKNNMHKIYFLNLFVLMSYNVLTDV